MADTIKPAHHGWDHSPGGEDPITVLPQGPGGEGFAASVSLPVMELAFQSNNLDASRTPTWTIDSTYPFGGYMQMSTQNDFVVWPVVLAPKGSTWLPYAVLAQGPDFGIVKITLGTALPVTSADDTDGLGGAGLFYDSGSTTFISWPNDGQWDGYAASNTPFPGASSIFNGFRIMGNDGAVGTSLSVATGFAAHGWDGGSGPHFLKLSCTTKNASSTGYKWRLSALGFIRVDWTGLF